MKVLRDVIKDELVSCGPGATVLDAARTMASHRLGVIAVLAGGRLAGILTEGDLLYKIVAENRDPAVTRVSEVMSTTIVTAGPDTPIEDAVAVLRKNGFRRIPVVDGDRLIGIISLRDLFAAEVQDALQENYRLKMEMMQGS